MSRCVQRAFLCGRDPKQWLVDQLKLLACCFGIEIYAYCISSNHFHLIARYDPLACGRRSDEEVARRCPLPFAPE